MLERLFGRFFERKSASAFEALFAVGAATAAQIAVTPETALRCVPCFAGVRVRCEVLGSLPLHLYERRDDGGKERATEHPLYRLLHDRPNAWTSAAELIMALEKDTITHGGGFALANRAGDRIAELIRLAPGSVVQEIDDRTLEPSYRVTLKDGSQRVYPWRDILHVPALDGLAAIKQAREAIGLCMALERHAGALLGNGARPSGVLQLAQKIDDVTYERLRKSWGSAHGGENSGKTAILESGVTFTPLAFNSVDMQFQEMRAFQLLEIARALGVPPMLIGEFGRATWGNAEQRAQAFLSFTILPRVKLWQGAVARLLGEEEQTQFYPEFLVDELVKAEIAARFEAYSKAIAARIYSPNEIRAMENRPPYEGGDEYANPNVTPGSPGEAQKPAQQAKPRIAA